MKPLTDSFDRKHSYARISVTDRCNLRCIYCRPSDGTLAGMPPQGIRLKERSEILTFDEIERLAKLFSLMGITKIRLTGGEPLVRKDLPVLVEQISKVPGIGTLGMTTNGVLLENFAHQLKASGLTHLNISLDTLRPSRFEQLTLRQNYHDVIAGINSALDAGFRTLKLNTVIIGGVNDDELPDFVDFVRDKPVNIRFIEYMPFKSNQWNRGKLISFRQMKDKIEERYDLIPLEKSQNGVSKDFRIEGFIGTVGFITSMSDQFCGTCNRIRLTADGSIKSCLFHPAEINLRSMLRDNSSDKTISEMIQFAISAKPYSHPNAEELMSICAKGESAFGGENRSMMQIGG